MHEDEVLFTEFFNQRLKEKGYTLKQLSDATGIAMKHLENFAHGRFERLPSAPYVHGYFVRLGGILGFDPDEWWNRIKKEDTVHKAGPGDRLPGNRYGKARGRALIWGGVVLALAIVYVGMRYTTILGQPQIIIAEPAPDIPPVSTPTITFRGAVRNGDQLTIEGQNVPLAADGSFSTDLTLQPGPNLIHLEARKFLGRTATADRQIYYVEAAPVIIPVTPSTPGSSTAATSGAPAP